MIADIELVQDENKKFRLLIDWMRVYNDQSLQLGKILEMVRTHRITDDLIIELEDAEI